MMPWLSWRSIVLVAVPMVKVFPPRILMLCTAGLPICQDGRVVPIETSQHKLIDACIVDLSLFSLRREDIVKLVVALLRQDNFFGSIKLHARALIIGNLFRDHGPHSNSHFYPGFGTLPILSFLRLNIHLTINYSILILTPPII